MSEEKVDTIIGEDIIFKGTLKFQNSLRLKGQMRGTIESNGALIVDETGQVDADITVSSLAVNGTLRGNVEAREKIDIGKTGSIVGDIKTPLLNIESGAKFSGNCLM
ncbi:MAG: polymer-forming cytoskeletal protein [Leptospiraceae bacterium]|nr:polymer-forming cytoskeletal protein [Leptospiraceae bacterium]